MLFFYVVRIFKNTWFSRFADKEGITDDELKEMANQLETGQTGANLGGGVYEAAMDKKYKSEVSMVNHQSAESLFRLGIIDADEMKEFDEGCLVQKPETNNASEKSLKMEHATA